MPCNCVFVCVWASCVFIKVPSEDDPHGLENVEDMNDVCKSHYFCYAVMVWILLNEEMYVKLWGHACLQHL